MKRTSLFLRLAASATILLCSLAASAATESILYSFHPALSGQDPGGGLISDAAGNLYGVTNWGGLYNCGTVFQLTPSSHGGWNETVLYNFCADGTTGGYDPVGSLVLDKSGNLYGVTLGGGNTGAGTVFELTKSNGKWAKRILWTFQQFSARDGFGPQGGLVFDPAGNLYGTTENGGGWTQVQCSFDGGCGTVYQLSPQAGGKWKETILYVFQGLADGTSPNDDLAIDSAGRLYGTTRAFYPSDGTVFELAPASSGSWTETTIYTFSDGADGFGPGGGLIFDQAGSLYGTAQGGSGTGCSGSPCGLVFRITPGSGGQWSQTVLYNFNGNDGQTPQGKLIFDQSGSLYGTTEFGGTGNDGIVFKLIPGSNGQWSDTVLWNFTAAADGHNPTFGVIQGSSGHLFGANGTPIGSSGGSTPNGNIFELTSNASGQWNETTLTNFPYGDGGLPQSTLVADSAGNFYGTNYSGGANGNGSVFKLTQSAGAWHETILYNFPAGGVYHLYPSSLIVDAAGNLYGETQFGGTATLGTVFELSPGAQGKWTEKDIFTFTGTSTGEQPLGGVTLDSAGNLYGTTQLGGTGTVCASGCGTVFKLASAGGSWTETVLYSFAGGNNDGREPLGGVILDSSGNLYGTTGNGGPTEVACIKGCGMVFELSPSGGGWKETLLHAFSGPNGDGAKPVAGLIFDASGNLYGTTGTGGDGGYLCGAGCGTVFELSPHLGSWSETILHSFAINEGRDPVGALVMDQAGNLYGTTAVGGSSGSGGGNVFELSLSGGVWNETVLHQFPFQPGISRDGYFPEASLTLGPDGRIYGTTAGGGTEGWGTVFALTP